MKRITIIAKVNENAEWVLVDENGNNVQEGFGYHSESEAIQAAKELYPANSVWAGRKNKIGWSISI